jgi:siroheme synthase-like protein
MSKLGDDSLGKDWNDRGNQLFPVFLKLENFNSLVVGGGNVGLEKLEALLNNSPNARITLVADRILEDVQVLAGNHPQVKIIQRKFETGDLNNKELVILATDDYTLHQHIQSLCKVNGILVNVADTPDLCDFYLGSIVKKGNLKIAISTNGKSPTIAKRVKQVLNDNLPDEIDETLISVSKLRDTLKGDFAYKVKRLNEVTASLVEEDKSPRFLSRKFSWIIWASIIICVILLTVFFKGIIY